MLTLKTFMPKQTREININPFTAKCGQGQNSTKIPKFRFLKFLNQLHHLKVQAERFHLNGHNIGFCPQTQKLEQGGHVGSQFSSERIKERRRVAIRA